MIFDDIQTIEKILKSPLANLNYRQLKQKQQQEKSCIILFVVFHRRCKY